jgi:hypothetical protein
MNVEIGAEASLYPEKEYIYGIFVAVYSLWLERVHLNSFCSLWLEDKNETMDDVIKKTKEVLPLMNTMERLLEEPGVRLSREIMSRDFFKRKEINKGVSGIVQKEVYFLSVTVFAYLLSYDRNIRTRL